MLAFLYYVRKQKENKVSRRIHCFSSMKDTETMLSEALKKNNKKCHLNIQKYLKLIQYYNR